MDTHKNPPHSMKKALVIGMSPSPTYFSHISHLIGDVTTKPYSPLRTLFVIITSPKGSDPYWLDNGLMCQKLGVFKGLQISAKFTIKDQVPLAMYALPCKVKIVKECMLKRDLAIDSLIFNHVGCKSHLL